MSTLPRSAVVLLYALASCSTGAATYSGLAFKLGVQTRNAVRASVKLAQERELVEVLSSGVGRGAKTVVRLTERGRNLLFEVRAWR